MSFRTESDSLGPIQVPSDKYYGAQTQRSLDNFKIGGHQFTREFIRAYGIVKKAAATVNYDFGKLEEDIKVAIHKKSFKLLFCRSAIFKPYIICYLCEVCG